jgi:hypothetical protein
MTRSEVVARCHGGGGLVSRGGRRGMATRCDATDGWGRAAMAPGVSCGVREGEG